MRIYTKDSLIHRLKEIKQMGWVKSTRPGNSGAVGNLLEDLLEIPENNLPLPNAGEWEIKCRRAYTSSLTTLCHLEPSPRALRFVPALLLPKYGWVHKTLTHEKSFRQTLNGRTRTDRGFRVVVDRVERKVLVSFDAQAVSPRHGEWLAAVAQAVGLAELNPQPYWGFDDLGHKLGSKLVNCFYAIAQVKRIGGDEYFLYDHVVMLRTFSLEMFLTALEDGWILVDFDARSGHNHGTKFRMKQDKLSLLYASNEVVI